MKTVKRRIKAIEKMQGAKESVNSVDHTEIQDMTEPEAPHPTMAAVCAIGNEKRRHKTIVRKETVILNQTKTCEFKLESQ